MDDPTASRRPGGSLEPQQPSEVLKAQLRLPGTVGGHRFELRDPFAEVIHRSSSFEEMVVKAERLGAIRFSSIAPDGQRASIAKENGRWPSSTQARLPQHEDRSDSTRPDSTAKKSRIDEAPNLKPVASTRAAHIQAELDARYVIRHSPLRIGNVVLGQTEYRPRADTSRVAFTESTFRLSTETNSPSVARSMIDVAQARGWSAIRISGSDDFRRLAWLEASRRDLRTVGYEPLPSDIEQSRKERERSSATRTDRATNNAEGVAKGESRGRGRKTVLAALDAVLAAKRVPISQREAVMEMAAKTLSRRVRDGQRLSIKVFESAAKSERPITAMPRQSTITRERTPSR